MHPVWDVCVSGFPGLTASLGESLRRSEFTMISHPANKFVGNPEPTVARKRLRRGCFCMVEAVPTGCGVREFRFVLKQLFLIREGEDILLFHICSTSAK